MKSLLFRHRLRKGFWDKLLGLLLDHRRCVMQSFREPDGFVKGIAEQEAVRVGCQSADR